MFALNMKGLQNSSEFISKPAKNQPWK